MIYIFTSDFKTNIMNSFDFNKVAILNGSKGLSDTEQAIFSRLTNEGFNPIVIDELHNHPERLILLKSNDIKTIITGTLVNHTLEPLFNAFEKLNWLPVNALITRGEELFQQFEDRVNMFALMPMNFSSDEIEIIPFREWL